MRVIAGMLRGRRLEPPRWPGLRPSSDRLRETLFNVVGTACAGARVLDVCAGTGSVGIEALSRGAAHVTFIDADARACRLVARNLAHCGVAPAAYAIVQAPLDRALPSLGGGFDLVYLDPPYADPWFDRWVPLAAGQVGDRGVLVVEHARGRALALRAGPLERTRVLPTGDSTLSFFRHSPAEGAAGDREDEPA